MKLKHLTIFPLILATFFSACLSPAYAKTTEEIQLELERKNAELSKLQEKLGNIQKDLNYYASQRNSTNSAYAQIDAEMKEIEAQIEYNNLKLEELEQNKYIKELEKEEREKRQDGFVRDSYLSWKMTRFTDVIFSSEKDFVKTATYQTAITLDEKDWIKGLSGELVQIENDLASNTEEKKNLEIKTKDLESRKVELAQQLEKLNSTIASTSGAVAGIRGQIGTVQSAIGQLSEEQKAIKALEDIQTGGSTNGGTLPIESGEIYFTGRGRDLYQGHGVGMSQFGAYGAAQKGWTAQQIVTFYYSQTKIEQRSAVVSVSGYGNMDMETYVAGLGEVPDKACGTQEQVNSNPAKYAVDNPSTIWDCWPAEAIKAQVIAARSYAMSYGGTICTTASCQVYKGGTNKQWAADETSKQVIVSTGATHNGQVIRALYSSDNNQGYGTADNDTVFSSFNGVGTPYSYLRHVNDTGTAASYSYTNWTWRTNSYTYAEINQMLDYSAANYNTGGAKIFLQSTRNSVGSVTGMTFVRDGSNRVKQVKFIGTNGSAVMSGWLFKAIWNNWVANVKPSGQTDYIYSLTWFMQQG
ncbi:hypothetical protein JW796_04655 [Candidatus Dojkabacteria bacterium]|nr:hypothetical protein [Candidatus Dojkabacteria bacterium]